MHFLQILLIKST